MTHLLLPVVLVALLGLYGCSLSGYQGSSQYACAAPDGVACDSISGVYANALQQRLPSQQRAAPASPSDATIAPGIAAGTVQTVAPQGLPLRSTTRVMRLWIKPWEDRDGDLHDQSFVYVRIDDGRWLLEHVQQQARDAYVPLQPPPATATPEPLRRPMMPSPAPFDPLLEPLSNEQALSP